MIAIRKGGDDQRGPCWLPVSTPGVLAVLVCPNGHHACICSERHTINATGEVSPSCICPRDGCNFHDFVKLENWAGK